MYGFEGGSTSSNWAKIKKCSSDTALRDLGDLVEKGILAKANAGGRGAHYVLKKMDAGSGIELACKVEI